MRKQYQAVYNYAMLNNYQ